MLRFTGFYIVLLSFTSFAEFYQVLPSFTGFLPSFIEVLPSFAGFYLVLLGFTLLGSVDFSFFGFFFAELYRVLVFDL